MKHGPLVAGRFRIRPRAVKINGPPPTCELRNGAGATNAFAPCSVARIARHLDTHDKACVLNTTRPMILPCSAQIAIG